MAAGDTSIDNDVIQAMAHWKTEESVKRYTQMSPADYARYVNIASKSDAGTLMRSDLPDIDLGRALNSRRSRRRHGASTTSPHRSPSAPFPTQRPALRSCPHGVLPLHTRPPTQTRRCRARHSHAGLR